MPYYQERNFLDTGCFSASLSIQLGQQHPQAQKKTRLTYLPNVRRYPLCRSYIRRTSEKMDYLGFDARPPLRHQKCSINRILPVRPFDKLGLPLDLSLPLKQVPARSALPEKHFIQTSSKAKKSNLETHMPWVSSSMQAEERIYSL